MLLKEIVQIIEGKVLSGCTWEAVEIQGGCGADLMSDVLAAVQPHALLLTGLCNPQVVRTAQMADVAAIVFVRGKIPPQEVIDLANAECVPLITTPLGTFELCGRLYTAGLPSLERRITGGQDE
jgi:predicted transcriptional regulator